jgi:hypothetical protein
MATDLDRVARAIDPEAWEAISDGRDARPDSLWDVRREIAYTKARAVLDEIETIRQEQLAHVRKLCRLDEGK